MSNRNGTNRAMVIIFVSFIVALVLIYIVLTFAFGN